MRAAAKGGLTRRTLFVVGSVCFAATLLVAIVTYTTAVSRERTSKQDGVKRYAELLVDRERAAFSTYEDVSNRTVETLQNNYSSLITDEPLSPAFLKLFNELFPVRKDGTRRSTQALVDGFVLPSGSIAKGFAGYIREGKTISPARKREFLAAFYAIRTQSMALPERYDNLFYYNEFGDILVYAPNQPDLLMFYKQYAPPNLDVSNTPFAFLRSDQKTGVSKVWCSDIFTMPTRQQRRDVFQSCQQPVVMPDGTISIIGSSLSFASHFDGGYRHAVKTMDIFLVSDSGIVLSQPAPKMADGNAIVGLHLSDMNIDVFSQLERALVNEASSATLSGEAGRYIVAAKQLPTTQWTLIAAYDDSLITSGALSIAGYALLGGCGLTVLMCLLTAFSMRISVEAPLLQLQEKAQRLANICKRPEHQDFDPSNLPITRKDEIGELAQCFKSMSHAVLESRQQLQTRVEERTRGLEKERKRADMQNQAKTEFIARMSHELRTPLNAILGFSEILKLEYDERLPDAGHDYLSQIAHNAKQMRQMIDDVFALAQATDQAQQDVPPETSILPALGGLSTEMAQLLDRHDIFLNVSTPESEASHVRADPEHFERMLHILVANAIVFNQAGGEVFVTAERKGDDVVRLSVVDTGHGLTGEDVRALVEPEKIRHDDNFEERDAAVVPGIGLTLCSVLARRSHAKLGASSQLGAGSTFYIDFKAPQQIEQDAAA